MLGGHALSHLKPPNTRFCLKMEPRPPASQPLVHNCAAADAQAAVTLRKPS